LSYLVGHEVVDCVGLSLSLCVWLTSCCQTELDTYKAATTAAAPSETPTARSPSPSSLPPSRKPVEPETTSEDAVSVSCPPAVVCIHDVCVYAEASSGCYCRTRQSLASRAFSRRHARPRKGVCVCVPGYVLTMANPVTHPQATALAAERRLAQALRKLARMRTSEESQSSVSDVDSAPVCKETPSAGVRDTASSPTPPPAVSAPLTEAGLADESHSTVTVDGALEGDRESSQAATCVASLQRVVDLQVGRVKRSAAVCRDVTWRDVV
jgi:hypothetical protein